MGNAYLNKGSVECVWPTGGYHTLEPYTMIMGPLFRYLEITHPGPFHAFRIGCSAKTFDR